MIELSGLTKRFGSTLAVDGLTFEVRPGRVTGFLGPNGAGKSTTMRLIVGLDRADAGSVRVNGRRYRDLAAPLAEVGALLEARAAHPGRSALNHLLFLARSNGIPVRRAREMLELVGLAQVASRRVGTFSLGMTQRLGIAAALLGDPPILLFDEPVNGLDPEGIIWIRTLMQALAAEGRAVLVSSHLMAEMALTASHLVVIGRGRLIADTTVEEFVRRSTQRSVRVRTPQAAALQEALTARGGRVEAEADGALTVAGMEAADIGEAAATAGIVLHELTPQEASLEAAFMELTRDSVAFQTSLPAEAAQPAGRA